MSEMPKVTLYIESGIIEKAKEILVKKYSSISVKSSGKVTVKKSDSDESPKLFIEVNR